MIIEGDNNTVIEALQSISYVPWQIATILEDVRLSLTMTNCTIINHIFREANQAADWLAKTGHSVMPAGVPSLFDGTSSPQFRVILAVDVIRRTLVRIGA